ncbi:MAG: alanine racemase [Candidatus Omnitrophica bacterium]|nr:alanine racemase [Candidatus Omnitrophota bacterium]
MVDINKIKRAISMTRTPFYLYDRASIKKAYYSLSGILPKSFRIYYAIKANPNAHIVSLLGRLGAGADVASMGELRIALKAGIRPSMISFTGPGKTEEELSFAIRNKIGSISVESEDEISLIEKLSTRARKVSSVVIRINPAFASETAGIRMGGGSQQFGIDEEAVPSALKLIKGCCHIDFAGVHMHTGSQILSEDTIAKNINYLLNFCLRLQDKEDIKLNMINFGGGLGIPYYYGQRPLDLKRLGSLIKDTFAKVQANKVFKKTTFIIEPGRFIVGQSGIYVTKVLYRKTSRGKAFLIVDGGMHQNMAAAGLLGEGLRRNRIIGTIFSGKKVSKKERVTVAGCLCTPLDILAHDIELPVCAPGDYLFITCSGAYGYSASPLGFLTHQMPPEVIL